MHSTGLLGLHWPVILFGDRSPVCSLLSCHFSADHLFELSSPSTESFVVVVVVFVMIVIRENLFDATKSRSLFMIIYYYYCAPSTTVSSFFPFINVSFIVKVDLLTTDHIICKGTYTTE